MEVKIIREWDNKVYKFGVDWQGRLFVMHKKCEQTMTLVDIKISNNKKIETYACSKCGNRFINKKI